MTPAVVCSQSTKDKDAKHFHRYFEENHICVPLGLAGLPPFPTEEGSVYHAVKNSENKK